MLVRAGGHFSLFIMRPCACARCQIIDRKLIFTASTSRNALIDRELIFHCGSTAKATARKGVSRVRVSAGLAPAPAKTIMTFGAVCRASMRAVMRNYLSSLPGLTSSRGGKGKSMTRG